jgi:hypothetical protein
MNEGSIILPRYGNDGSSLVFAHAALRDRLLEAFGGLTASDGRGIWRDPSGRVYDEPVTRYDVAMAPSNANVARLRDIAAELAKLASQEAVYVKSPTGSIDFVTA